VRRCDIYRVDVRIRKQGFIRSMCRGNSEFAGKRNRSRSLPGTDRMKFGGGRKPDVGGKLPGYSAGAQNAPSNLFHTVRPCILNPQLANRPGSSRRPYVQIHHANTRFGAKWSTIIAGPDVGIYPASGSAMHTLDIPAGRPRSPLSDTVSGNTANGRGDFGLEPGW
jgi:hypothetical protein